MVMVKICGITNLEDAMHAWDCGADEIGFNFYRGSKRFVPPETAREILDEMGKTECVGVFVNEPVESIIEIAEFVGLFRIQLHGDEDKDYLKKITDNTHAKLIKAFRVGSDFKIDDAVDWMVHFRLFDSRSLESYGGTGEAFDWEKFGPRIFSRFPSNSYLAGGLTPENVAEAIRLVRPFAVDVASGVESSPGKKDPRKVEAFIENAKNA